jgi:hypothetical protein
MAEELQRGRGHKRRLKNPKEPSQGHRGCHYETSWYGNRDPAQGLSREVPQSNFCF